jgi:hypothetical protein
MQFRQPELHHVDFGNVKMTVELQNFLKFCHDFDTAKNLIYLFLLPLIGNIMPFNFKIHHKYTTTYFSFFSFLWRHICTMS